MKAKICFFNSIATIPSSVLESVTFLPVIRCSTEKEGTYYLSIQENHDLDKDLQKEEFLLHYLTRPIKIPFLLLTQLENFLLPPQPGKLGSKYKCFHLKVYGLKKLQTIWNECHLLNETGFKLKAILKNKSCSQSLRHFGQVLLLTPADDENRIITEDGTQRIVMHSSCSPCTHTVNVSIFLQITLLNLEED